MTGIRMEHALFKKATSLIVIVVIIMLIITYIYTPNSGQESITFTSFHYSPIKITYEIDDDLEFQLSVIPIDFGDWMSVEFSHSLWSYFNCSIINKSNQLKTIQIDDDYFDVFLYQDDVEIYNIRQGMTEFNEKQLITLVPHGYFSNPKYNGASQYVEFIKVLPEGSYTIEGMLHFNSETFHIVEITLEISKNEKVIMVT